MASRRLILNSLKCSDSDSSDEDRSAGREKRSHHPPRSNAAGSANAHPAAKHEESVDPSPNRATPPRATTAASTSSQHTLGLPPTAASHSHGSPRKETPNINNKSKNVHTSPHTVNDAYRSGSAGSISSIHGNDSANGSGSSKPKKIVVAVKKIPKTPPVAGSSAPAPAPAPAPNASVARIEVGTSASAKVVRKDAATPSLTTGNNSSTGTAAYSSKLDRDSAPPRQTADDSFAESGPSSPPLAANSAGTALPIAATPKNENHSCDESSAQGQHIAKPPTASASGVKDPSSAVDAEQKKTPEEATTKDINKGQAKKQASSEQEDDEKSKVEEIDSDSYCTSDDEGKKVPIHPVSLTFQDSSSCQREDSAAPKRDPLQQQQEITIGADAKSVAPTPTTADTSANSGTSGTANQQRPPLSVVPAPSLSIAKIRSRSNSLQDRDGHRQSLHCAHIVGMAEDTTTSSGGNWASAGAGGVGNTSAMNTPRRNSQSVAAFANVERHNSESAVHPISAFPSNRNASAHPSPSEKEDNSKKDEEDASSNKRAAAAEASAASPDPRQVAGATKSKEDSQQQPSPAAQTPLKFAMLNSSTLRQHAEAVTADEHRRSHSVGSSPSSSIHFTMERGGGASVGSTAGRQQPFARNGSHQRANGRGSLGPDRLAPDASMGGADSEYEFLSECPSPAALHVSGSHSTTIYNQTATATGKGNPASPSASGRPPLRSGSVGAAAVAAHPQTSKAASTNAKHRTSVDESDVSDRHDALNDSNTQRGEGDDHHPSCSSSSSESDVPFELPEADEDFVNTNTNNNKNTTRPSSRALTITRRTSSASKNNNAAHHHGRRGSYQLAGPHSVPLATRQYTRNRYQDPQLSADLSGGGDTSAADKEGVVTVRNPMAHLSRWQQRQEALMAEQRLREEREIAAQWKDLTFKPDINSHRGSSSIPGAVVYSDLPYYERLNRPKNVPVRKSRKEDKEETFKPQINPRSAQMIQPSRVNLADMAIGKQKRIRQEKAEEERLRALEERKARERMLRAPVDASFYDRLAKEPKRRSDFQHPEETFRPKVSSYAARMRRPNAVSYTCFDAKHPPPPMTNIDMIRGEYHDYEDGEEGEFYDEEGEEPYYDSEEGGPRGGSYNDPFGHPNFMRKNNSRTSNKSNKSNSYGRHLHGAGSGEEGSGGEGEYRHYRDADEGVVYDEYGRPVEVTVSPESAHNQQQHQQVADSEEAALYATHDDRVHNNNGEEEEMLGAEGVAPAYASATFRHHHNNNASNATNNNNNNKHNNSSSNNTGTHNSTNNSARRSDEGEGDEEREEEFAGGSAQVVNPKTTDSKKPPQNGKEQPQQKQQRISRRSPSAESSITSSSSLTSSSSVTTDESDADDGSGGGSPRTRRIRLLAAAAAARLARSKEASSHEVNGGGSRQHSSYLLLKKKSGNSLVAGGGGGSRSGSVSPRTAEKLRVPQCTVSIV